MRGRRRRGMRMSVEQDIATLKENSDLIEDPSRHKSLNKLYRIAQRDEDTISI